MLFLVINSSLCLSVDVGCVSDGLDISEDDLKSFNMMISDQTVCSRYLVLLVSDPSDYFSNLSFEVLLIPENLFSDRSRNVLTFLVFQPNVGIRLF